MTQEPDNLLIQLREIRATLAGHTARFERLEKGINELRHFVSEARLGTRGLDQGLGQDHERSEERDRRVDDRLSDIEGRVARLEEGPDV
jgi:hypothetical protein